MAREPQIEYEGYAFDVRRFANGGCVVRTSVTPSRYDKQTGEWVDLETMFFDVTPYGKAKEQTVAWIESLIQQGESVQVLVSGNLTEKKGQKGGTFKNVFARRLHVIGHRPKNGGAPAQAAPAPAASAQASQGPVQSQSARQSPSAAQSGFDDPWAGGASFSSFGATDSFSAGPDEPEF